MNSPRKSQPYGKQRPDLDLLEWAKTHCLRGIMGVEPGVDEPLVDTLKSAIDASLKPSPESDHYLQAFAQVAEEIIDQFGLDRKNRSFGFLEIDLRQRDWEPLFIHDQLLRGLKRIAGYERSLIVFRGLKTCFIRKSNCSQLRWQRYYDVKDDLDTIISDHSTSSTVVQVIYI
ncbi:MAG: hypothetical protein JJU20_04895 [Opitutales bacterium]|nr:hypothetical protein [Opitutales bacterium]